MPESLKKIKLFLRQCERVQQRPDAPALLALTHTLSERVLALDKDLGWPERLALMDLRHVNTPYQPPAGELRDNFGVPLSSQQTQFFSLLVRVGKRGLLRETVRRRLWPDDWNTPAALNRLRVLLDATNKILKKYDPLRRRIYPLKGNRLVVKTLAKTLAESG